MIEDLNSTPGTLFRFLVSVYGAPAKITSYRYLSFAKQSRNKKRVQLACLPPTSASAQQHFYRVYYEVQVWLGISLDPQEWGSKLIDSVLEPIHTLLPPAPEKLLNTIFCNCKKGCSSKCSWKKVCLFRSTTCISHPCGKI